MSNHTGHPLLIPIVCTAFAVFETGVVQGDTISANPVSSGEKAAVYGGIAAAAGIIAVAVWLVVRKASGTGCIDSRDNALVLLADGGSHSYSLAGNTGTLKAGERVRLSGKRDKGHHTFVVTKVSEDLGSCTTSSGSH